MLKETPITVLVTLLRFRGSFRQTLPPNSSAELFRGKLVFRDGWLDIDVLLVYVSVLFVDVARFR